MVTLFYKITLELSFYGLDILHIKMNTLSEVDSFLKVKHTCHITQPLCSEALNPPPQKIKIKHMFTHSHS